ncbi:MAG: translation initiation factor IF-2 [Firmicutes bacterium]|nr:translation initiation factor IF-2 [Bacillota bacterium]
MEKLRVYELAKKAGVDSKVVMKVLGQLKVDVKNHMSTLEPLTVQTLMDIFSGKIKVQEVGERGEGELTKEIEIRSEGSAGAALKVSPERPGTRMANDRLAVRVGGPANRPVPETLRQTTTNRDRLATRQGSMDARAVAGKSGVVQKSRSDQKGGQGAAAGGLAKKGMTTGPEERTGHGPGTRKETRDPRPVVKTGLWTPEMDQSRQIPPSRRGSTGTVRVISGSEPDLSRFETPRWETGQEARDWETEKPPADLRGEEHSFPVAPDKGWSAARARLAEVEEKGITAEKGDEREDAPQEAGINRGDGAGVRAGAKEETPDVTFSSEVEPSTVAKTWEGTEEDRAEGPSSIGRLNGPARVGKTNGLPRATVSPSSTFGPAWSDREEKRGLSREGTARAVGPDRNGAGEVRTGRDRLTVLRPEEQPRRPLEGPIPRKPGGNVGLPIRRTDTRRIPGVDRPVSGPVRGPVTPPRPGEKAGPAGEKGTEKVAQGKKGAKRVPERERSKQWLTQDEERLLAKVRPGGRGKAKPRLGARVDERPATPRVIALEGPVSVKDLAEKMAVKGTDLLKKLISMGVMATINQEIDLETAAVVAEAYGVEIEEKAAVIEEPEEEVIVDDPADLVPRAPVVTVMGHVDHGKTSLLDAIRKTNVTAQEAGGITQHIGASTVEAGDRKVVFLDTPGHEAFTAMRARGAKATDIAVLVVAADDGVMPQTVEAINHARAAGVPIVVAINKIDKPNAQPERVKQQLTEYGLVGEEWGGTNIMVPVSARDKTGIDHLLEMLLLVADMEELKANPKRAARGIVIEAQLDKGRGPVGTVLIQNGTLSVGDVFVSGRTYGKVRAMTDDRGRRIKKAGPATPVEILGFTDVPSASDIFIVVEDERKAKEISARRQTKRREEELRVASRLTLDDLYRRMKEGELKELNLIIKGDVQGTVEAVRQSLEKLGNEETKVRVIHAGVGAITETDVMLASASGAIIIGFDVRPEPKAREAAETEKVDVRSYRVIYDAIDDVKAALKGMLSPKFKETTLGRAEVRATFKVPKVGTVAGSYVQEGKILRNAQVRLIRDGVVVHEGKIESLKHFKDDVREVTAGKECGIGLERFQDVKEGDIIEAFIMEQIKEEA